MFYFSVKTLYFDEAKLNICNKMMVISNYAISFAILFFDNCCFLENDSETAFKK
jgi:hypothetical protein